MFRLVSPHHFPTPTPKLGENIDRCIVLKAVKYLYRMYMSLKNICNRHLSPNYSDIENSCLFYFLQKEYSKRCKTYVNETVLSETEIYKT